MQFHFIDVGCGNMILMKLPNGKIIFYDCNITKDNQNKVLNYIDRIIGVYEKIDIFINSHRDADHMRGIKLLHTKHPINIIWDSGVPGTTTDSPDYREYMELCRIIGTKIMEPLRLWKFGNVKFRCMNSQWDDYKDANDQSIVFKIEYAGESVMLSGDTSFKPWKEKITKKYYESDLKSSILLASHHGSISFFDDPSDTEHYYTDHVKLIKPTMTLISVGSNIHNLPDTKAVELYKKYSTGSNKGNKVYSTEDKGTMKLIIRDSGGWILEVGQ